MSELKYYCICVLFCFGGFVVCEARISKGICSRYSYAYGRFISVCCDNYIKDETSIRLKCKPICMPKCTNSICSMPGVCYCNLGYSADPLNDRNCLPVCADGCPNGVCVSPSVCECNHGYVKNGSNCSPVCTEPCHNGTCISPENCLCDPGYRMSDTNTCEPYCSIGCNDGQCIGPEICTCDPGWQLIGSNTCKPICSPSCFNGICVAPNKCKCNAGYDFLPASGAWSYTCVPHSTTTTEVYQSSYEPGTTEDIYNTLPTESTEVVNSSDMFSTDTSSDMFTSSSVDETETVVEIISEAFSTETSITDAKESQEIWIYVTVCLVLLVAILLLLSIVFKTNLLTCTKGGSYVVQDLPPIRTQDSFNVTFSAISKK